MWNNTIVSKILKIKYPIIQAPMAGGPSTPKLIAAVSNSGGLGSIGAGYLTPEKLKEDIIETKGLTDKPFSVNIFVPEPVDNSSEKIKEITYLIAPYRKSLGLTGDPPTPQIQQTFDDQMNAILDEKINIVSFTFGIPSDEWINRLKENGTTLIGTANTVDEAILLDKNGVDIIVAQGSEAGGHRGAFLNKNLNSLIGTMALVPQVVDNVDKPVIAAGGIMDARGIVASLILGASGVQMGTVFLTCIESGASKLHKEILLNKHEDDTTITKMFTGKYARGISNKFTEEMKQYEEIVPDFPLQGMITSEMRKESVKQDNPDYTSLWAGQGIRMSKIVSVGELMNFLVNSVNMELDRLKDT